MLSGTIYDVVIWQPYIKNKRTKYCNNNNSVNNNEISFSNGNVDICMANNNNDSKIFLNKKFNCFKLYSRTEYEN